MDGKLGVLGLDGGDIKAGPARVLSGAEVEFTPGSSITAVVIGGNRRSLSGSPATLRVGVEGVVLGFTGSNGERVAGVAVPAVHLAILADLVPDHNEPVLCVGTGELHDVLVAASLASFDSDNVAAIGAANVASVGNTGAARFGARAETRRGELAAGGNSAPVSAGTGGGGGGNAGASGGRGGGC